MKRSEVRFAWWPVSIYYYTQGNPLWQVPHWSPTGRYAWLRYVRKLELVRTSEFIYTELEAITDED